MSLRTLIASAAALAVLGSAPAGAGTLGATFGVRVIVSDSSTASFAPASAGSGWGNVPGLCISQSLSEATGAVVRVVCRNGQFVSISPQPGRRFPGTHGGAYGYYFGPTYGAIHRTDDGTGSGTVTSFRVYSVDEAGGFLDLLVSF